MSLNTDRVITIKELGAITSLSRATIGRLRKQGDLPEPLPIPGCARRVGWSHSTIQGWMAKFANGRNN